MNGLMAFLRRSLSERHGPRHWPGIGMRGANMSQLTRLGIDGLRCTFSFMGSIYSPV